ncbi:hypothetical protein [Sphingomonas sp. H160509]|uniref:hypothetical protein n=1 Tax=Sphingomonas sp. H160509 TaxID=2955313 RepID=UPI003158E3D8
MRSACASAAVATSLGSMSWTIGTGAAANSRQIAAPISNSPTARLVRRKREALALVSNCHHRSLE